MGTKDFFDLFKLNILKNSRAYLFLIFWFILFAYIPFFVKFLPLSLISFLAEIQKNLPQADYWVIPSRAFIFIVWVLSAVLLIELYVRFKNFIKRGDSYSFTESSWNKDWTFNGKTNLLLDPLRLKVNSSRAGCLYNARLWKNFKMKFQMRFLNDGNFIQAYNQNIGIIFRAKDLENYFMLELLIHENEVWLKPHVRYQGMWEAMSEDRILPLGQSEPEWIREREWFKVKLVVKENVVSLTMSDMNEYQWSLPTHVDINHIESGVKEKQSVSADREEFGAKITDLPKIDFKDSFGMLGFRAHLYQGAEIKNLNIKVV